MQTRNYQRGVRQQSFAPGTNQETQARPNHGTTNVFEVKMSYLVNHLSSFNILLPKMALLLRTHRSCTITLMNSSPQVDSAWLVDGWMECDLFRSSPGRSELVSAKMEGRGIRR
ncbi:hypothetical protein I7I50_12260 [Histoplasma capsulatum G186AR]|uniref:Uncharacterized protein n=1 Tax=Ajellomyces capsulatus TaxID=5037 RepID=A0A8H7YDH8_AJECA|nr:hypothetical protein I7I52_11428 [Histoplasma capsulatum]QSS70577.1 hypothetical protein I7I50_12260 [Histoplasma capsulatum G186AR]